MRFFSRCFPYHPSIFLRISAFNLYFIGYIIFKRDNEYFFKGTIIILKELWGIVSNREGRGRLDDFLKFLKIYVALL